MKTSVEEDVKQTTSVELKFEIVVITDIKIDAKTDIKPMWKQLWNSFETNYQARI